MLVLLFALLFILRGDLFHVLPFVILFLYFSVLLALRLLLLGKRMQILVLFVPQLALFINLQRAIIGPLATLTGR